MIPGLAPVEYILLILTLGAYGFAWACYKKLSAELDRFLVNHIAHEREAREKLEAKVDLFIEGYHRSLKR